MRKQSSQEIETNINVHYLSSTAIHSDTFDNIPQLRNFLGRPLKKHDKVIEYQAEE